MLRFKDSSSQQAEQNSFRAESLSFSLKNSFTLCVTLMLLRLVEWAGFFLVSVCGGWFIRTLRFCISSHCEGARRWLKRDGMASCELTELLPASLASLVVSLLTAIVK